MMCVVYFFQSKVFKSCWMLMIRKQLFCSLFRNTDQYLLERNLAVILEYLHVTSNPCVSLVPDRNLGFLGSVPTSAFLKKKQEKKMNVELS